MKINDLVVTFYKNDKEEQIIDIGVIKSLRSFEDKPYADIELLYSKFSLVKTDSSSFIHAPESGIHVIGNMNMNKYYS